MLDVLKKIGSILAGILEALKQGYEFLKEEAQLWGQFDLHAKKTSRLMGLTKEQAEQMRTTLLETQFQLGKIYNVSAEEIANFNTQVSEAYGRVANLSAEAKENFAALKTFMDDSQIRQMVEAMDEFGASTETAMGYLQLSRSQAQKLGLNANKATEALSKNVKELSKFGFKNGISDIQQMTLWSQRLKINFESIANATKNFNTIQGAIENSAKIQMLGGELAYNYSNPLEVMSEAMFDAESFGKRIADSIANMGVFDKATGTVRVESWLDRAKIQQYAESIGMSVDELTKMANQQAKYREIEGVVSRNLSEEQRQAIASMAQFNADTQKWEIIDAMGQHHDVEAIKDSKMLEEIAANTVSHDRDTNIKNIAGHVAEIASWSKKEATDMIDYNARWEGRSKTLVARRAQASESMHLPQIAEGVDQVLTYLGSIKAIMMLLIGMRGVSMVVDGYQQGAKMGLAKVLKNLIRLPRHEHGGIIAGNDYVGDNLLARVNSGEMVLNKAQQAELWNMANGGGLDDSMLASAVYAATYNAASNASATNDDGSFGYVRTGKRGTAKVVGTAKPSVSVVTPTTVQRGQVEQLVVGRGGRITTASGARITSEEGLRSVGYELNQGYRFSQKGKLVNAENKPIKASELLKTVRKTSPTTGLERSFTRDLRKIFQDFATEQRTAIKEYKNTSALYQKIANKLSSASAKIGNVSKSITTVTKNIVHSVVTHSKNVFNAIKESRVVTSIERFEKSLVSYAKAAGNWTKNGVVRLGRGAYSGAAYVGRAIANSRLVTGTRSVISKAVHSPISQLAKSTVSNTGRFVARASNAVASHVGDAMKPLTSKLSQVGAKSVMGAAKQRIAQSSVARMTSQVTGKMAQKAAVKAIGSVVKGGGPAAIAGFAMEGLNMLGQSQGWWKQGGTTSKMMNVGADVLSYAGMGAMIGSAVPVIGNAVGAAVGGAIGLFKGVVQNFGSDIKRFLVGGNTISQADMAQQQYEETKMGMDTIQESLKKDPTGESLKVVAAQAVVKMHDILISIWHHLNGRLSNGEKRNVGLWGKIKGLFGGSSDVVVASPANDGSIMQQTSNAHTVGKLSANKHGVFAKPTVTVNEETNADNLADKAHEATVEILSILQTQSKEGVSDNVTNNTVYNGNISRYSSNFANDNITNSAIYNDKISKYSRYTANSYIASLASPTINPYPRLDITPPIFTRDKIGQQQPNYVFPKQAENDLSVKRIDTNNTIVSSVPVVGSPTPIVPKHEVYTTVNTTPMDVNLNVSGTLKLDATNLGGRTVDIDINKLLENNLVKKQIVDIIISEFSKVNGKTAKDSSLNKTGSAFIGFNQFS